MAIINQPFTLPCGTTLRNRVAKAALTERLADASHLPNQQHLTLYTHWAKGGAAMLLSGNIMIDERYLESAGNVALHALSPEDPFKNWTKVVTDQNNEFWAQLNHPGRQATIFSTLQPVSASDVKLKKNGLFAKPRPLKESEIEEIIQRFINAAGFCRRVGFTGVQFHAAHGYLFNQFLSPRTNKRTDQWGGDIENRSRLLFRVVEGARKLVGNEFPLSVKLNSADFQRGGFEEEDAIYVIKELEKRGLDLIEISGGTYERVAFFTQENKKESTKKREAYFLDFAKEVRKSSQIPLMVTGGFRTLDFCNEVLEAEELDVIGFGRPFLLHEQFPCGFLDGTFPVVEDPLIKSPFEVYFDMAVAGFYDYQIARLATGKRLRLDYPGWKAIGRMSKNEFWNGIKNRIQV